MRICKYNKMLEACVRCASFLRLTVFQNCEWYICAYTQNSLLRIVFTTALKFEGNGVPTNRDQIADLMNFRLKHRNLDFLWRLPSFHRNMDSSWSKKMVLFSSIITAANCFVLLVIYLKQYEKWDPRNLIPYSIWIFSSI